MIATKHFGWNPYETLCFNFSEFSYNCFNSPNRFFIRHRGIIAIHDLMGNKVDTHYCGG